MIMKQTMCRGILIAALLVISAKPVLATDVFNRPGPYLGLGMAGGLSEFGGAARGAEDSVGFNFRGGTALTIITLSRVCTNTWTNFPRK